MPNSDEQSLLNRLLAALPPMSEELKTLIREKLQATLSEQGFVTREAFDVQAKVLARTREKVDALEKEIKAIEEKLKK
jgi:BMFP domain-containing protein YqiC